VISNNNEKDQLNYVDLTLNEKEGYYFSLLDLLKAFYKRKYILFSIFSIVFIVIIGFLFNLPENYKVQLKVNLTQDVSIVNPYKNEIGEVLFVSDMQAIITKKIDQMYLNKVFFEENQLNNTGFFFTETKQPKIEIENLKSNINLLSEEVLIDLISEDVNELNELITSLKNVIELKRIDFNIDRDYRIALLEEAREIAIELDIIDVAINFTNEVDPMFTMGIKHLLDQLNTTIDDFEKIELESSIFSPIEFSGCPIVAPSSVSKVKDITGIVHIGYGRYLAIKDDIDFDFQGDFTVEFWVQKDGQQLSQGGIISKYEVAGWIIETGVDEKIHWRDQASGTTDMTSKTKLLDGMWYHVAVTRNQSTYKLFINGILEDLKLTGYKYNSSRMNQPLLIGKYSKKINKSFIGFLDEIRISNIARYSDCFNPELVFIKDKNTILLIHGDKLDGSREFKDSSGGSFTTIDEKINYSFPAKEINQYIVDNYNPDLEVNEAANFLGAPSYYASLLTVSDRRELQVKIKQLIKELESYKIRAQENRFSKDQILEKIQGIEVALDIGHINPIKMENFNSSTFDEKDFSNSLQPVFFLLDSSIYRQGPLVVLGSNYLTAMIERLEKNKKEVKANNEILKDEARLEQLQNLLTRLKEKRIKVFNLDKDYQLIEKIELNYKNYVIRGLSLSLIISLLATLLVIFLKNDLRRNDEL
jgi:hypothetical protein